MRPMGDRQPADRIRNVALVGHRGAGKTSLHEALLFEAGATSRLGSVPDASTVSDADPDEQSRQMSISASLSSFEWRDRKINLLDTPGEPSFVADALGALRVCESAVFVVNAVMGVEVSTSRLWARAAELDIARMLFVNMLDRERADFYRALEQIKRGVRPARRRDGDPDRRRARRRGVIDLVDMKAFRQDSSERGGWSEMPIPDELAERAQEYREKLMDEVCEVSDTLMERYLEGEEISHEEIVDALKEGTNHGKIFPVVCGVATRNLGTSRLLDAIVEDLPSPVKHGSLTRRRDRADAERGRRAVRVRVQDARRSVRRADQPDAHLPGRPVGRQPRAQHARARQGAHRPAARVRRQGGAPRAGVRPGRHRRRGQAQGDPRGRLAGRPRRADRDAAAEAARAGDGVCDRAQEQGRRGEGVRVAAPAAGGGPDDRPAPRPADRRADRRRALAGARRSGRRPAARPLRRRGHPAAAARPLPGDDPQLGDGARQAQEAVRRPRAVRRLPHRDRAAGDVARSSSSSTRSRAA